MPYFFPLQLTTYLIVHSPVARCGFSAGQPQGQFRDVRPLRALRETTKRRKPSARAHQQRRHYERPRNAGRQDQNDQIWGGGVPLSVQAAIVMPKERKEKGEKRKQKPPKQNQDQRPWNPLN